MSYFINPLEDLIIGQLPDCRCWCYYDPKCTLSQEEPGIKPLILNLVDNCSTS